MEASPILNDQQAAGLLFAAQHTHDAIVITDSQGLVTWMNHSFHNLCGYTFSEVVGRKPGEILQGPSTDPLAVERIRAALAQQTHCREDILNYHKDGHPYWVSLQITPVRAQDGGILQFIAIERDITPAKMIEAELRQTIHQQSRQNDPQRILLVICASCKRIRTEAGRWQQIELYMRASTHFDFSHGFCPECVAKLYPDD